MEGSETSGERACKESWSYGGFRRLLRSRRLARCIPESMKRDYLEAQGT